MASRETEFANRMAADSTLMAILTGGVYRAEAVGPLGITRETAPGAFSGGFLRPVALVKQRGVNPDFGVQDEVAQRLSVRQVVELWFYNDSGAGYAAIDSAMARTFTLFYGWAPPGAFPAQLAGTLDRMRDEGALRGANMARQDWLVVSILGS